MSKKNKFFLSFILKRKRSNKKADVFKLELNNPIPVKMKENMVDNIAKFSALAAVILAFVTVVFDCSQSKKQDVAFHKFQTKLDSTLTIQLENAKSQHNKTIALMENQKVLIQRQNDSTIQLLKIQADRMKAQNEIWKTDMINKIFRERAFLLEYKKTMVIENDTVHLLLLRENKGQRPAKIISSRFGFILLKGVGADFLYEFATESKEYEILPGAYREMSIDFPFPISLRNEKLVLFSKFEFEDDMLEKHFTISNFYRIKITDGELTFFNCSKNEIDIIEKNTEIKDDDFTDFTIKKKYLPN